MDGSSDSDATIVSAGSSGSRTDNLASGRRRFLSSSPPPNAFLTPAFTAAASADGSISNSPLNIDLSLLRFTQSRHSRLRFSSSSSSNESPDSSSPSAAAVAARMRLQQLVNVRSLSSSSRRSSTQSPLSPIENLQLLPLSERSPPYPIYSTPMKVEMGEDVLVMDALDESLPIPGRIRQPLELHSSSSSSSSVNNNPIGANFFIKTDICRSWEERGFCRFGSRCQFAHGKEELRGSPRPSKSKPESGKQISAFGSTVYGDKYVQSEASSDSAAPSAPVAISKPGSRKMKIIKPERDPPVQLETPPVHQEEPPVQQEVPPAAFSWPPTEADAAEIQRALYGPSRTGRRLPVFLQISPTRSNSFQN